jgi:hypothetical protein
MNPMKFQPALQLLIAASALGTRESASVREFAWVCVSQTHTMQFRVSSAGNLVKRLEP